MLRLLLLLWLATAAGCLMPRTLRLEVPSPRLDDPAIHARWRVNEVIAHNHAQSPALRDYVPLKEQLERRLYQTLMAQQGLGYPEQRREYEVAIEVDVREDAGLNGWLFAGMGAELGVLAAGSMIGTAVAGPPGGLAGLLIATPLAIAAAVAPPAMTELGEFELKLVLRKVGGDEVATRHLRQVWRANVNGYGRQARLAALSGDSVLELERTMLATLRELLLEVPDPLVPPAPAL